MLNSRSIVIKKSANIGKSVVYVMSRDQRVQDNHALLEAQALAEEQTIPLYVLFVLRNVDTRSREHYQFMLDGLREVSESLSSYGIPFVLRSGDSPKEIVDFANEVNSGVLIFDSSPLKGAKFLISEVANKFDGSVTVIDTHNIIPVWVASEKKEFAAHTFRKKVHKKLNEFLTSPRLLNRQELTSQHISSLSFEDAETYIKSIPNSGISIDITAGEKAAHSKLESFIDARLELYAQKRNDMSQDYQSGLSPYLHFGQLSSLRVALDVIDSVHQMPLLLQESKLAQPSNQPSRQDGMNALLEEMIVRKELSDNFCYYSKDYMTLDAAPDWAQKSLFEHAGDRHDFVYGVNEWEAATTHDEIWNAAQIELIKRGKMHGYMRMYWAKKILEWSSSSEEALKTAIYLNDKYSIDGGDPSGYVGILWSIAGLHDRPWFERPVFGKVRYMNDAGLRRKFAIEQYIQRVKAI